MAIPPLLSPYIKHNAYFLRKAYTGENFAANLDSPGPTLGKARFRLKYKFEISRWQICLASHICLFLSIG
jgi:hypothetical protein